MRVLVVTNDYPPAAGGIQRFIGALLRNAPWEARVAAPAHPDAGDVDGIDRYDGALVPTRRVARWVAEIVEADAPDVVLYGAFPLALIAPTVARRTRAPYAVLLHGAEVVIPSSIPLLRNRYRAALHGAAARLAVSRYTQERVGGRFDVPVDWIGAGVDVDEFSPAPRPHDGFVVGCVGRFVKRKGHEEVLRASGALRGDGLDVRATVVGWGPRERRLRRVAAGEGVPVEFLVSGSNDALVDAYRGMDVFAMPVRSRWGGLEVEGLGLVYLEAAACGVPVIAGSSGGAPETVDDGVTGFVVDDRRRLREALERLARDPGTTARMGAAGRERVLREYTWPGVVARVEEALHDG
jgi:phosphatidylinositol alpha-1,6-mannosyltransferase